MTEAMQIYRPAQFRRVYVDSEARLSEFVPDLAGHDAVGVDLEMGQRVERKPGGLQEWIHLLALIQIATDGLSLVIDPLRCHDLSPLRALISGPTRKVFLGGSQDVALLEREDLPVRNIVDVGEAALGLYGRREDGMAALAHRIFGVSLDKTVRRTDWLVRPLNTALITYAHRDAELTLLIYRWFKEQHPELTEMHERLVLDPPLPAGAPVWLQEAVRRPVYDTVTVAMEHGFKPERIDRFATDLDAVLLQGTAPRQINRLLRIAGELGLKPILPHILSLAGSPSSLLRAAVARAIGQLAEPEEGLAMLEPLQQDQLEDVRKAARQAMKELTKPSPGDKAEEETDESPALGGEALAALQQLRAMLEPEE